MRLFIIILAFAIFAHTTFASDIDYSAQFIYESFKAHEICYPYVDAKKFDLAAETYGFPFIKIENKQAQICDIISFKEYIAMYIGIDAEGNDLMNIFYNGGKKLHMRVKDFPLPIYARYRYQPPNDMSSCEKYGNTVWEDGKVVHVDPRKDRRMASWIPNPAEY